MSVIVGVQARLNSKRLPKKVLREIRGVSMIRRISHRLRYCKLVDEVVFLIPRDDHELFHEMGHEKVLMGEEGDVLSRYVDLANTKNPDYIVRVTGDCPLVMPELVDEVVKGCVSSGLFTTNVRIRSYPKGWDVECITRHQLLMLDKFAKKPEDREHVTKYLYDNCFMMQNIGISKDLSKINLSVDTYDDFDRVVSVYKLLDINTLRSVPMMLQSILENEDLKEILCFHK